jgi:hypothetical protein
VAETLGRLDLRGGSIVECPAVLEVRLLGRSKMKTLQTILGHLRLLTRLFFVRILGRRSHPEGARGEAEAGTQRGGDVETTAPDRHR